MRFGRRAAWSPRRNLENIVVRAAPDGSIVRLKDVARIELGAQNYNIIGALERQAIRHHRPLPASRIQRRLDAANGAKEAHGGG